MDPNIGKKMGNFDIIELIGKGGMASVYRAHQPSMNRSVAIKIMATQYGSDNQFVQRFKNEAKLVAQLEHAHILPVYDFGDQDGALYIVMRYLSAGDLGERIPEGGMPVKEAGAFFRQLASALDYAHSRGVIHRDLKPANVLIDDQKNAFLTDFGIAKSIENESNLTGTGGVVGTPTYMSPEQGLGEPLDGRSDIYALGVMLFEMLSGQPPFSADNPMAVMLKHINDAPPSLRSLRAEISTAIEAVVMRALAKDPNERYTTALEMADALDEAIQTGIVPKQAAAFTEPQATLTMGHAPRSASGTMAAPVAGAAAGTTAIPAQTLGSIPMPEAVPVTLNGVSEWLLKQAWLGSWIQAGMLSLVTFLLLRRLTSGGVSEITVLSVIPGLIIYGLLRAPTVGGLVAFVLILVPLLAHAPALALLWAALTIIAGARLNSREIMLTLVTVFVAGTPIGWVIPLLAPWWLKPRRVVLPVALGVAFAGLFALTLGWPNAGNLLPVASGAARDVAVLSDFSNSYIGLLEPSAWSVWTENAGGVISSIGATYTGLAGAFAAAGGLPLIVAAAWSLAAVLSVSNQHSESPILRGMGLGLGLIVLVLAQILLRGSAGLEAPSTAAIALALGSALAAFLLSQWPIQADPNAGNKIGTVLRLLRQTLGALFMAMGVVYFANYLADTPFYVLFFFAGVIGLLTMITNPLLGPAIVFAGLVAAFARVSPLLMVLSAVLLGAYLLVNLLFDRRRPRSWNPLGAGFMVGAPGMMIAGVLPIGPLSIGALEAQVPAAILAALGHVLLVATATDAKPIPILLQVITTIVGVLLVERLMGSEILNAMNHKLRRLLFTIGLAVLMVISYYVIAPTPLTVGNLPGVPVALGVSAMAAIALVAAMGQRAIYWRQFVEREVDEDEEYDEELTNSVSRVQAAKQ